MIMTKQRKIQKSGAVVLMIGSLVLLPNCGMMDWVKEKFGGGTQSDDMAAPMKMADRGAVDDGSAVLATIDGKPLITQNMLEVEKKKLVESNPQMEAMLQLMDAKQLDRNLADGMMSREVIRKYVKDRGIQNQDQYKKDFETAMNQVRDLLNTRYFMQDFGAAVNDKEVHAYYEENKDRIPELLLSRGGVESKGISFKNEQQARDFMAKVREAKNDLTAAAKAMNLSDQVKDFNLVNDQSLGMEPELREKIVKVKTVPSIHNFKVDKEFWIVQATKREEPKYRELETVKNEIKQLLEKEKTMKRVEEEVARLKNEYNIQLNEDFFSPRDNAGFQTTQDVQEEGKTAQPVTAA
jgi:hypothetical protein